MSEMIKNAEVAQPVIFCANSSDSHKLSATQLSEEELSAFFSFLDNQKDYLDTGLGAFHTDNHSNW